MAVVTGSVRILVSVEALNMSETVGNLVRHKRAPVIIEAEDSVEVRLVPVISGQSIAHGYQVALAEIARRKGLPVCKLCEIGVFAKHGSQEVLDRLSAMGDAHADTLRSLLGDRGRGKRRKRVEPGEAANKVFEFEKLVVENCIVEDVGGFLFTGQIPVRRTSRIWFSYAVPSRQFIRATAVETVLHARHDILPGAGGEEEQMVQMLYNVEVGAAVYTFTFLLDVDGIGVVVHPMGKERFEAGDRAERVEAAVEALAQLISGMAFGAKKSRFLPHAEIESVAVAVVRGARFVMPGAHSPSYVCDAARRLEALSSVVGGVEWRIAAYIGKPRGREYVDTRCFDGSRVVRVETPEEVFVRVKEWLKS